MNIFEWCDQDVVDLAPRIIYVPDAARSTNVFKGLFVAEIINYKVTDKHGFEVDAISSSRTMMDAINELSALISNTTIQCGKKHIDVPVLDVYVDSSNLAMWRNLNNVSTKSTTNFKIGDKVRVTMNNASFGGKTGTILSIQTRSATFYEIEPDDKSCTFLITENEICAHFPVVKTKFKVGDEGEFVNTILDIEKNREPICNCPDGHYDSEFKMIHKHGCEWKQWNDSKH